jgi:SAM-dependent methyltransferase
MRQASIFAPITSRLLREAGLSRDMRVLDVGCGVGDVTMLAAELAGPSGSVVAIDRNSDALAVARDRTAAAGYTNIKFCEGNAEDFADPVPFDFAVGRFVLVHQADPAAFIRAVASHVRPGGVVAFHEPAFYPEQLTAPPVPLWSQARDWIFAALSSVMPHPDAGRRLVEYFHDAGLKRTPTIFCEVPIAAGVDSPVYGWTAHNLRSLLSQIEKIGAGTAGEIDIDTFEDRLRSQTVEMRGQLVAQMQFCGWTRL